MSLWRMWKSDRRAPLELQWGIWVSSRVAAGNSGFLLSCSPLVVAGTQCSSAIAVWNSGFHLRCGGELGLLSSWEVTQGSSRLVVGPPLEFPWGNSSLVGMCKVAPFLLQCASGYSLVLAWDSSSCGQGQLCSCGGFNSL